MLLKRRYITLLEILIIFAIVAAAGGAAAFNIRKFYQQQQALDDINKVINVLNTASELMMLVNLDSEVRFSKVDGVLQARIAPQSGVSTIVQPLVKEGPISLPHLGEIVFKDGVQQTTLTPPFSLTFKSKGFLMNRGILQLQGKNTERYVVFRGYPTPFAPLLGSVEYQDPSFRDRIEKMTEHIKTLTSPP